MKNSEDEEEENNTSPVKRPSALMSGKMPPLVVTSSRSRSCSDALSRSCFFPMTTLQKKLKMESDEDDDDSNSEEDEEYVFP